MSSRVETPKQLALRVNVSARQIHKLITRRRSELMIGCRVHIPTDAWEQMIERKRTRQWHDEIKAQSSDTLKIAEPSISPGQSTVAAASSRLAQQAARKLKIVFAEWLHDEPAAVGPSDPAEILVTDILAATSPRAVPRLSAKRRSPEPSRTSPAYGKGAQWWRFPPMWMPTLGAVTAPLAP